MHDRYSITRLCLLCCLMIIPTAVWGHHPNRAQPDPQTPAHEQAKQLVAKGVKYLSQHDYRQAAMTFQVATQLDPEDADAYFSWGVALGALEQRREEIEKYQQAVHYNPNLGEAYVTWALALWQLGQEAEAKEKLLKALAVAPDVISPQQITILKSLGILD